MTAINQTLSQALPQFEHIRRYWDPVRKLHVAQILPGEVYVTKNHELISTLLGSCIAVCMRDKTKKIGGMNHFKLPKPANKGFDDENTNYGIYAMELLINEILKNGGNKINLEATVFGGGNMTKSLTADIGGKNTEFVLDFLRQESIPIIDRDTGHNAAQQIYYHPVTGKTFSVIKQNSSLEKVREEERLYMQRINAENENSGMDFF